MTVRLDDRAPADRAALEFRASRDRAGMVLVCEQFLPRERVAICEFFADALNLQTLTPAWLHFAVLTPAPIRIQAGTLIDYRLRLHGIPLRWQSRIEVWEPPVRFVDVQIRGPYRRWHHEHVFEEVPGGTLCRDIVHYAVPGGRLIERLFVRPDLTKIFAFRWRKLQEVFGGAAS
jgi:ligand-binding SRPBCC domain-containing protein